MDSLLYLKAYKIQLKQIAYFDWPKQQELIWTKFADSLDWTSFTQRANLTGQPSISLPIYRNADGAIAWCSTDIRQGKRGPLAAVSQANGRKFNFM